jgi:hypothetical protein
LLEEGKRRKEIVLDFKKHIHWRLLHYMHIVPGWVAARRTTSCRDRDEMRETRVRVWVDDKPLITRVM